jgi:hypothetical protein
MRACVPLLLTTMAIAFSSTAAPAEDSGSCMQDAFAICSQFIPNREGVASCLISNRSRVSAGCRAALAHFNPRTNPHTASVR